MTLKFSQPPLPSPRFITPFKNRVLDIARASVICESPELVRQLVDKLKSHPEVKSVDQVKNGFGDTSVGRGGYRDIKVYLQLMAIAHYVEVQVINSQNYSVDLSKPFVPFFSRVSRVAGQLWKNKNLLKSPLTTRRLRTIGLPLVIVDVLFRKKARTPYYIITLVDT